MTGTELRALAALVSDARKARLPRCNGSRNDTKLEGPAIAQVSLAVRSTDARFFGGLDYRFDR